MTDEDISQRLDRIEAQLRALTNLTLCHVQALDVLVQGSLLETLGFAATQRDGAIGTWPSVYLNALMDSLREVGGIPPESDGGV